eukprot:1160307-Pelagomonas_calceolata.AAC.6
MQVKAQLFGGVHLRGADPKRWPSHAIASCFVWSCCNDAAIVVGQEISGRKGREERYSRKCRDQKIFEKSHTDAAATLASTSTLAAS